MSSSSFNPYGQNSVGMSHSPRRKPRVLLIKGVPDSNLVEILSAGKDGFEIGYTGNVKLPTLRDVRQRRHVHQGERPVPAVPKSGLPVEVPRHRDEGVGQSAAGGPLPKSGLPKDVPCDRDGGVGQSAVPWGRWEKPTQ